MIVSELIKELKKLPPDANVYLRDHDQSIDEINGFVNSVDLIDSDEIHPMYCIEPGARIVVLHS